MANRNKVGRRVTIDKKSSASMGDVFGFFNEIGIIEQLARTQMERVLPGGMKISHFGVLNHMVRLGLTESPAELASAFQVTRPSMTNTVQKLEAHGYVTVEPDPKDGRGKLVLITAEGRQARESAIQTLAPLFDQLVTDIGLNLFTETKPKLEAVRVYMDDHRRV